MILRQLVNFALSRKIITADPLGKLRLKKPKLRPQPSWSRAEVDQILAAAREPHRSMLPLLAETGMRVGELKHLTWADVDFEHEVILIREKEGWKPKTGDERAIPMSSVVLAMLRGLPRNTKWVFTAPPSHAYTKGGQPISERRLLEYLKRVLKRLGLQGHLHTFLPPQPHLARPDPRDSRGDRPPVGRPCRPRGTQALPPRPEPDLPGSHTPPDGVRLSNSHPKGQGGEA